MLDSDSIKFFNVYEDDIKMIKQVIQDDSYQFKKWAPSRNPKFIVDVGSQIGSFCYMSAFLFPECKILGYEMLEKNYHVSLKNLEKFNNVSVFNKAIIGDRAPNGFWKSPSTYGCRPLFSNPLAGRIDVDKTESHPSLKGFSKIDEEIRVIDFNQIFNDHDIDYIDYLKMDCEGSEYEILPSLESNNLFDKILSMGIEVHGNPEEKKTIIDILERNFSKIGSKGSVYFCSK